MQERNHNIDIIRAMTLLLVIVYHSWVVCGSQPINWPIINTVITLGGELGVTAFFILSGYGIYCSLYRAGKTHVLDFFKKRALRIMPQYYLCLAVVILLGSGAYYLSAENIGKIISHCFFIHTFWPSHFGAINGVLWTMGVTVQFYLIAIPLYKGTRKFGIVFWIGCIAVTIFMKYITFAFITPQIQDNSGTLNFMFGRQIFTALDNFVTGMMVAHFSTNKKKMLGTKCGVIISILGIVMLLGVCKLGQNYGIHTNNISGYIWHSGVAVAIMIFIIGVSLIPLKKNIIVKSLLWVASYEYGTYLWHLIIFNNLIEKSAFIQQLIGGGNRKIVIAIFVFIALGTGYISTKLADAVRWKGYK